MVVVVDEARTVCIPLYLLVSEVDGAWLHGVQETILVDERDEHNGFPLLFLAVEVRFEVDWIVFFDGGIFIDHDTLRGGVCVSVCVHVCVCVCACVCVC